MAATDVSVRKASDRAVGNLTTLATDINREHKLAYEAGKGMLEHAIRAGRLLMEAKALVQHSMWEPWLSAHFEGSERTARAYMQVASKSAGAPADFSDLTIEGALKSIAVPRAPKPAAPPVDPESGIGRIISKAAPAPPPLQSSADAEPSEMIPDAEVVEIPDVLTVAEERRFSAALTQLGDTRMLLGSACAPGLGAESVAGALRDASHACRRAAMNLGEIADQVERRV